MVPKQIPFMFKLPDTKEEFIAKKLPGNYAKLFIRYQDEGIVKELEDYEAKQMGILSAIDDTDTCYVIPTSSEIENPVAIEVYSFIVFIEKTKRSICCFRRRNISF